MSKPVLDFTLMELAKIVQKRDYRNTGFINFLEKNGEIYKSIHDLGNYPKSYSLYFEDEAQLLKFQMKYL